MAKKKNSPVVYTPIITSDNIPQVNTSFNQQIPQYEDSSVRYQGKYKIQTGQNEYELRGQIPFQIQLGETHTGGVGPMSSLSYDIPVGKKFIITSISLSFRSTKEAGWFVIYSAGLTTGFADDRTVMGFYHGHDEVDQYIQYTPVQPVPFPVIRKLVIDGFSTRYQTNLAGAYAQTNFNDTDYFFIILNGFLEEM